MKVVTVKRELSGSATLGRPTVYSCEGWEISIRRGHVVSVKSPEGDPDNKGRRRNGRGDSEGSAAMNDENLGKCADHGGEWGLSCGFWAKYPNLLDEHINRRHVNDPSTLEILRRSSANPNGVVYYDFFPNGWPPHTLAAEDFHPDPVVTELRKRPMHLSVACNVFAGLALYVICVAICALALGGVVWFVHEAWVYFGG